VLDPGEEARSELAGHALSGNRPCHFRID
jgi:hypothetical protein